ncbi:MAG: type II toxin-antitoxin system RatA family toxin [Candidatus Polarisedimenticolaceae bacterium]|nr:type II toxin-antitoxin system RatA family toxin [Candidatus Polarisedimenticolaceae bacterium]
MPVVNKSALIPFSAAQMYALVDDFEAYPDFLPWCRSSRLISRTEDELCGELEVARAGIRQTFSTRNRLVKNERMDIELIDGPFRKLQGCWKFTALREDACKIELVLDFEFSGRLINSAFGKVFSQIANTMVDAFCKRAEEVYCE